MIVNYDVSLRVDCKGLKNKYGFNNDKRMFVYDYGKIELVVVMLLICYFYCLLLLLFIVLKTNF